MKKVQDIVVIREVDGRDKPEYINIGVLLTKDNGKQSMNIKSVPTGNWDGWAQVFDKKAKDSGSQSAPDEVSDIEPF